MALQKSFTTKFGVTGDYINFDPQIKNKTTLLLSMKFWKDKATRNTPGALAFNDSIAGSSSERIEGFKCLYECPYNLSSSDNIFKQGYDYLKMLPEFAGAIDC